MDKYFIKLKVILQKKVITIEEDNTIEVASPCYTGRVSILRSDSGFISGHGITGYENKDIYFSFKVLKEVGILQGDSVKFNIGRSIDKIWAENVEKIESTNQD